VIGTFAHPSTGRGNICATDYEEVTVSTAAVGLTPAKLAGSDYALMRVIGGPLRLRLDGPAPTATMGVPVFDGENWVLVPREMNRLLAIRSGAPGAVDGTLCVVYYEHNAPPP